MLVVVPVVVGQPGLNWGPVLEGGASWSSSWMMGSGQSLKRPVQPWHKALQEQMADILQRSGAQPAGEGVLGDKATPPRLLTHLFMAAKLTGAHGALHGLRASGRDFAAVVGQKTGQVGGLELLEDKEDPQE